MKNIYEVSLLLDFYGQMLTERQYEILDLHFNNDFSLGEIAENLSISRQGVFDNIKRGKAQLEQMEEKLKLVEKFVRQREIAERILNEIKEIDMDKLNEKNKKCISIIRENIMYILD